MAALAFSSESLFFACRLPATAWAAVLTCRIAPTPNRAAGAAVIMAALAPMWAPLAAAAITAPPESADTAPETIEDTVEGTRLKRYAIESPRR